MTIINVYIIAAMAIILLLTGFKLSRKRGYIIPSRIDLQLELAPVPLEELQKAPRGESSAQIRERVIRACSIADLAEHHDIGFEDITEAVSYRNLDRNDWAERGI